MGNEHPLYAAESAPDLMRLAVIRFWCWWLLAAAASPALAVVHTVTDFKNDFSGAAADTFKLDRGWSDSLLMDAQRYKYKHLKTLKLNAGAGANNGLAGSGAVVTSLGTYSFKAASVSWPSVHQPPYASSNTKIGVNVVTREIYLDADTDIVDSASRIIGGQEVSSPEAPIYLNLAGEGSRYAAYWSPNGQYFPLRRSSSRELPPDPAGNAVGIGLGTPADITGGFGKLSSCLQPGSGGSNYAVVYEMEVTAGNQYGYKLRWEDINAGTTSTTGIVNVTPKIVPEDFAVAMDSLGNTVVLWREQSDPIDATKPHDLWLVAYDAAHTVSYGPAKIRSGIFYQDTTPMPHNYRPYAITSQCKNNFLIAYSRTTGANTLIYFTELSTAVSGSPTADTPPLTPASDIAPFRYIYPDLQSTGDRVVVTWFKRNPGGPFYRVKGSILDKVNNHYTLAGRVDMDMANVDVNFFIGAGIWDQYHYSKNANAAMDSKGNVVLGFDNGTSSFISLVRNTPVYYDSSAFISKTLAFGNPAVPAFTFDPAKDSARILPFRFNIIDSLRTTLKVAVAADPSFAGAVFTTVPDTMKTDKGLFKYKVEMKTRILADTALTNLSSPKVKSLQLEYDLKPWLPVVDSIKPGTFPTQAYSSTAAYPLLPRKDSLKLICSGFDADDDGMEFRLSLGNILLKSVTGIRVSPGNYTATITLLPPDTVLNPLPLSLTTIDPEHWSSKPFTMFFDYSNIVPTQTITVFRNKGRDSASVYRPSGAGIDTLHPANGDLLLMQKGDSLSIKALYADGNDDNVTATWLRNATQLGTRLISTKDSLVFKFSPDNANPLIDTVVMKVGDPNITTAIRFAVRPNRLPVIDSIFHASYKGKDSIFKLGPFDKVKTAADTGLIIPAGLLTVVQAGVSDTDQVFGDTLNVKWRVWKQGKNCALGNLACYQQTDTADGPNITRVFTTAEQYLTVRVTDNSGAFRERKIWLEYPVLDTSTGPVFAAALQSLRSDIDFILGSEDHDTTVKAEIVSKGSTPLKISSVKTKNNDKQWLDIQLDWLEGTPPRPKTARFSGATTANLLATGDTIRIDTGVKLTFTFHFESDSLRGDSIFYDTLLVVTNDFANPLLRIPFKMEYDDLPVMTLGVPGSSAAGPANGHNAAGLPKFLPARSTLSVSFSETVRVPDPNAVIKVYSVLDSIAKPDEYRYIKGNYTYIRKRILKASSSRMAFGKAAAAADSLADQLIFTPDYDRASDSLKVRPQPGFFIYRDVLHIKLTNAIVDRANNGLDLRLDKKRDPPGSLAMVFQAKVDTSLFKVASSEPEPDFRGWNPESPIKIRFNRKLAQQPPAGTDSITLLALGSLKSVDSRAVRVTSVYRPGKPYDLQSVSLEDGDSSLVIRTRPRLSALDTVTVTLSGGLMDTSGLSLDGNGNRFPDWLYDRRDSVDSYTFNFSTTDADFYVYPNPYRFSDSRHREKGTITFKNLNSLRGYAKGDDLTLRIHSMTGDLLFNSDFRSTPATGGKVATSLDWDLKNNHGSTVATGVYLYSLMSGGRKLLHKGKVAVVR